MVFFRFNKEKASCKVLACYVCNASIMPGYNDWYKIYESKGYICQHCFVRRNSNLFYLKQEAKIRQFSPSFNVYEFMKYEHCKADQDDAKNPILEQTWQTCMSVIGNVLDITDETPRTPAPPKTPEKIEKRPEIKDVPVQKMSLPTKMAECNENLSGFKPFTPPIKRRKGQNIRKEAEKVVVDIVEEIFASMQDRASTEMGPGKFQAKLNGENGINCARVLTLEQLENQLIKDEEMRRNRLNNLVKKDSVADMIQRSVLTKAEVSC